MNATVRELPTTALSATGQVQTLRILAWTLAMGAVASILVLLFTPWQQSVSGSGRVIAYAPLERQQPLDAPISGRVTTWFVQEGERVKRGDPIVELSDNDPEILDRLGRERDAAQAQVDAATVSLALTEASVTSMETARDASVATARMRVQIAMDRREAALRAVDAAEVKLRTAKLNFERRTNLFGKGLVSKRDLELAELEQETSRNDLERAKADLRATKAEVVALQAEQDRVTSSNAATIEAARSSLEKIKADRAKAQAELAKVEVRRARQQQMKIVAPRDGTVLRILGGQDTDMVKAGEPVVLLVPDVTSRAVEIYVDGNDVPLIEGGRAVRLQFEGWPAVQFVGWPSVAVGTFGGEVAFVDSHDDGTGRFRVVVVPEEDAHWPEARYLRQGVRANGWILLNRVSLGFELWRQFNGFPPALVTEKEPKGVARKRAK